ANSQREADRWLKHNSLSRCILHIEQAKVAVSADTSIQNNSGGSCADDGGHRRAQARGGSSAVGQSRPHQPQSFITPVGRSEDPRNELAVRQGTATNLDEIGLQVVGRAT
ncbi:unnamed protein product, partial [Amoebophrya sp. A120]